MTHWRKRYRRDEPPSDWWGLVASIAIITVALIFMAYK
jgi:hypothetical protein